MARPLESIVMRKCGVSYNEARQLGNTARVNLNLRKDIVWSKELEEECIRLHSVEKGIPFVPSQSQDRDDESVASSVTSRSSVSELNNDTASLLTAPRKHHGKWRPGHKAQLEEGDSLDGEPLDSPRNEKIVTLPAEMKSPATKKKKKKSSPSSSLKKKSLSSTNSPKPTRKKDKLKGSKSSSTMPTVAERRNSLPPPPLAMTDDEGTSSTEGSSINSISTFKDSKQSARSMTPRVEKPDTSKSGSRPSLVPAVVIRDAKGKEEARDTKPVRGLKGPMADYLKAYMEFWKKTAQPGAAPDDNVDIVMDRAALPASRRVDFGPLMNFIDTDSRGSEAGWTWPSWASFEESGSSLDNNPISVTRLPTQGGREAMKGRMVQIKMPNKARGTLDAAEGKKDTSAPRLPQRRWDPPKCPKRSVSLEELQDIVDFMGEGSLANVHLKRPDEARRACASPKQVPRQTQPHGQRVPQL